MKLSVQLKETPTHHFSIIFLSLCAVELTEIQKHVSGAAILVLGGDLGANAGNYDRELGCTRAVRGVRAVARG